MKKGVMIVTLILIISFLTTPLISVNMGEEDEGYYQLEIVSPSSDLSLTGGRTYNISWEVNSDMGLDIFNSSYNFTLKYTYNRTGPHLIKEDINGTLRNFTWKIPVINTDQATIILEAEGGNTSRYDRVAIGIDSKEPRISDLYPKDGDIAPDSRSYVEFNLTERVVKKGFQDNFTLKKGEVGEGLTNVSGTFQWLGSDESKIRFIPSSKFELNQTYTYFLNGSMQDLSEPGNHAELNISNEFKAVAGPPEVSILSPTETFKKRVETELDISWRADGKQIPSDPVSIYYSTENTNDWKEIKSNLSREGNIDWELPLKHLAKYPISDVKINVTCKNMYGFVGYSHSPPFSIYKNIQPDIDLKTTMSNRYLNSAETYEIEWECLDEQKLPFKPITISLSRDGGRSWQVISLNEKDDGSYNWTIDQRPGKDLLLNVSCIDSDGAIDWAYSSKFNIVNSPPVDISLDVGNETIRPGEELEVSWNFTQEINGMDHIRLLFSGDGRHWRRVGTIDSNENSFKFEVPFEMSSKCAVKLQAHGLSEVLFEKESKGYIVLPQVSNSRVEKKDGYAKVITTFDSEVNKNWVERSFTMVRGDKKVDIDGGEIYWNNDSSFVYLMDDPAAGDYELFLEDENIRARDFPDVDLLEFSVRSDEGSIIDYWPVLFLVPIAVVLLYLYKGKDEKSKVSKDKIKIER